MPTMKYFHYYMIYGNFPLMLANFYFKGPGDGSDLSLAITDADGQTLFLAMFGSSTNCDCRVTQKTASTGRGFEENDTGNV